MFLRRLAKSALCETVARAAGWIDRPGPIVLGYHQVAAGRPDPDVMPGLAIGVAMLERHIDWLGRHRRFVSLDEMGAILERGDAYAPVAALTFDDGYAGVVRDALPVLVRKGVPATLFVVSGAVEGGAFLHDRLYQALARSFACGLGTPPALGPSAARARTPARATRAALRFGSERTIARIVDAIETSLDGAAPRAPVDPPVRWDALRAWVAAGMGVGSHGRTHALLVGLPPDRLRAELEDSRRELESRLGAPVGHFAYPDGQYDPTTVRAVEAAGYRFAYTACHHRDPARPLLTIPRIMLWEESSVGPGGDFHGAILSCQAVGALPLIDRCDRPHGEGART